MMLLDMIVDPFPFFQHLIQNGNILIIGIHIDVQPSPWKNFGSS
jgi:hypothetical protein